MSKNVKEQILRIPFGGKEGIVDLELGTNRIHWIIDDPEVLIDGIISETNSRKHPILGTMQIGETAIISGEKARNVRQCVFTLQKRTGKRYTTRVLANGNVRITRIV